MIPKINLFFKKRPWLVVVAIGLVTVITLVLTLLPVGKVAPKQIWSYDKLGHLLIFGGWTFLLGYYRFLKKTSKLNLLTIFFIGVLFGSAVELLQYVMPFQRSADFFDIAFDALGCFLAIFILHLFQKESYANPIPGK